MAVVVVNKVEFGIVNFGRPLEGLNNAIVRCSDRAEGGVGIRRTDIAGGAEYFTDVFREVVAIGEPRAVLLDCERTRRGRLRRIPSELFEYIVRIVGIEYLHAKIAVVEET